MIKVIFFLDYDSASGNGHLQRCERLKEIFPKNSKFLFINYKISKFLKKNNHFFDYGIIDSYRVSHDLEKKLKKICNILITIDDLKNRKYSCDILINYSPLIKKKEYLNKVENKTKLLLGNNFNFMTEFKESKLFKNKKKFILFFYLGQKNRSHIIKQLLSSIKDKKRIKKIFIFGNQKKIKPHNYFLTKMDLADILIVSPGVALQEGLSRKKIIFSKFFSKNQRSFFSFYKKKNIIKSLSEFEKFINLPLKEINLLIQKQIQRISLKASYDQLLNIKINILPIFDNNNIPIVIKKYSQRDSQKIFSLQNRKNRQFFKNIKTFSYKEHKKYLIKFLNKKTNFLYTILLKKIFVGFIKLELKDNKFYVSIIIHEDYRGRNIATNVLTFFKDNKIFDKDLVAEINKKNLSSIEAFTNANFLKKDIILF